MRRPSPLPLLSFLAAFSCAAALVAEPLVLRGGTFHPVASAEIVDGVMVIDGGKIVALGPDVEIPAGSTVVELSGRHVYPGFVAANTQLGLTEIESVRATVDHEEMGELNSDLRAEVAINADSRLLPVALSGGVLTAQSVLTGGVLTGTSAVITLAGWNWQDMTLRSGVGLHLRFPATAGGEEEEEEEGEEESSPKSLETIDQALADARLYQRRREAGVRLETDLVLEGLLPVLAGEMPLFIHAESREQIEDALDWASKEGFERLVLVTGPDAQHLAERLAEEAVPVILAGVRATPERRFEPYDTAFEAAKRLHEAGVRFAIAAEGASGEASNVRNLPFNAALAASFGLPQDVALRSITLTAAEILGVADRVGSLAPGKDATFFVADGDPLEIVTRIERVWVRGEEIDLDAVDPQRRLYKKYWNRPRPGD